VAGVVLAAGTGTRLAPLTDHVPKPLLPVLDRSLLWHQIERLEAAGAERIYVNLHHHAGKVASHLELIAPQVIHRVEAELTGPAGALSLFADLLAGYDTVLVASSDVLVGGDLTALLDAHAQNGAALTFGVVSTTGARRFGVLDIDASGAVNTAREKPDVPDDELHLVSAGVYCLRPDAIDDAIRLLGRSKTIDYAKDLAPALLAAGSAVAGHRLDGYWRDVGTPASLLAANRDALEGRIPSLRGARPGLRDVEGSVPVFVHPSAVVETGATLEGSVVVGSGARVGTEAWVADAVILPEAVVPARTVAIGGIVAAAPGLDRVGRPAPAVVVADR
jgi:NDP-sugar pyrophosphorylase family protein